MHVKPVPGVVIGMGTEDKPAEKTLLDWAMRLCPDSPRKRVKEWIASGRFYLDGDVVSKAGERMPDPGESLTFGKPDSSVASWAHRKKIHPKLTVLYMDKDLAIVDKAAGLLSVPFEDHSLSKGSRQVLKSALSVLGDYLNDPKGEGTRRRIWGNPDTVQPLPVHRLDQYTSGLLCIALNPEARKDLIDQLRRHQLLREYIAVCDGEIDPPTGSWKHYLKLDKAGYRQSINSRPLPGAVQAVTHYSVEQVFKVNHVTRLRIRLETGLKHQIRIQAAEAGVPLIGDRLYHPATVRALKRKGAPIPYGFRRQALHAVTIGLRHPSSARELRFDSPVPSDLQRLQERMR
ncbi:MAG: RluA family pseudouridine synthase [Puniceicoccaceae bacterium]